MAVGIQPAVSAPDLILRLIEHEVPRYGLVHLLDLPEERLEISELVVSDDAPAAGGVYPAGGVFRNWPAMTMTMEKKMPRPTKLPVMP